MRKKCQNCGGILPVEGGSSCPNCGLLFGDDAVQSARVTEEQERTIIDGVSTKLAGSRGFLWRVSWRTFTWFFGLLGLAFGWGIWSAVQRLDTLTKQRFEHLDRNMSNLVTEANTRIVTNIALQFEEPRIRTIVAETAANEAKQAMLSEIKPQVERFREEINGRFEPLQLQARADAKEIAVIRNRTETQAATMGVVTQGLAEAKMLVDALKKENEKASARLQEMETYAKSLGMLRDGRLLLGGNLTGRAWIVEKGIANLTALYSAGKFDEAYVLAKDCVERYEESAVAETSATTRTGDVFITSDGAAQMYSFAVMSAQRAKEHDTEKTLNWARRAVALKPNHSTKALLVTQLMNAHLNSEAQSLIDETLKKGDADADQFKELLLSNGVLIKVH